MCKILEYLNIFETLNYLDPDKFSVSLEHADYRRLLHRIGDGADRQDRVTRFLDPHPFQLPTVILALADWLPKLSHRLLWIEHVEEGYPSQKRPFLEILGDKLSADHLVTKPGILIGPLSNALLDQLAGTPGQDKEAEALVTLCCLLCIGQWDAKLLAKGSTDYIEFWEGNVLFYSESNDALKRATEILDFYELTTPMT